MNHDLISSWFGLPPDAWPPNHYRLLGLDPGEADIALIELRVQQRLDIVRPFQMRHPEQATEAMNRIAQAFVCLTEPGSKQAYDALILGKKDRPTPPLLPGPPATPAQGSSSPAPPPGPSTPVPSPPPLPAPAESRGSADWLGQPGVPGPGESAEAAQAEDSPPDTPRETMETTPRKESTDPIVEAAQASRQMRRGLESRRAIHARILWTRNLLRTWQKLGPYFADPEKKFTRPEAGDLYRLIEDLHEVADGFPLLGEPGQPGHQILSLGELGRARMLLNLTVGGRQSLERDWKGGQRFLELHLSYLRAQRTRLPRQGRVGRFLSAGARLLSRPLTSLTLICLGALAIGIASWRTLLELWRRWH